MAVGQEHDAVTDFDQWYVSRGVDERTGALEFRTMTPCADAYWRAYDTYKREMDTRVSNYDKLEMLADGEVISKKPDLPNISSGETAGIVRRIARNLVQHTPNVEVISEYDDDSMQGIFSRHILLTKIIGDDHYSNDMQQNLFSSTKQAFTLGFDCVIPVLQLDARNGWYMKYDAIHYRDVFPEPGATDVRQATDVYIRRYLTKGEVMQLIKKQVPGWDVPALKLLLKNPPPPREYQSVSHQDRKRGQTPDGYEIITWYSSSGNPFLTFSANTKLLLRIEKNKHPLRLHPVHFLVLEKDALQPLGKSQVELLIGRQEFQDLMLNGAMKLWYRNINPSIIGYGTINSIPNLSPGKYTQVSNPNAKIEPFEVNTQTLLQYGQISAQNLGSMVQIVGAADQQMATQGGGQAGGMSATPQGVEAQQAMVDITTNNYQKAIESFFSHYCSYALTIYFQELKGTKEVAPTADARKRLIDSGLDPAAFDIETGTVKIDFSELATEYWVRCVPGSLVEMEDEKQLRVLNQMMVPLSQALPAIANANDPEMMKRAAQTIEFIIEEQIKLSGAASSRALSDIFKKGLTPEVDDKLQNQQAFDDELSLLHTNYDHESTLSALALANLQEQVQLIAQTQAALLQHLGVVGGPPEEQPNTSPTPTVENGVPAPSM